MVWTLRIIELHQITWIVNCSDHHVCENLKQTIIFSGDNTALYFSLYLLNLLPLSLEYHLKMSKGEGLHTWSACHICLSWMQPEMINGLRSRFVYCPILSSRWMCNAEIPWALSLEHCTQHSCLQLLLNDWPVLSPLPLVHRHFHSICMWLMSKGLIEHVFVEA